VFNYVPVELPTCAEFSKRREGQGAQAMQEILDAQNDCIKRRFRFFMPRILARKFPFGVFFYFVELLVIQKKAFRRNLAGKFQFSFRDHFFDRFICCETISSHPGHKPYPANPLGKRESCEGGRDNAP